MSSVESRPMFLVNSAKVKCNADFSLESMYMCFSSKLSPIKYPCLSPKVRVNLIALI